MIQDSKKAAWIDESGNSIPRSYLSKRVLNQEKLLSKLIAEAQKVSQKLKELKILSQDTIDAIISDFAEEKNVRKDTKGNKALYSFDRSVRLEISVNPQTTFDDLSLDACKQCLDKFLNENINSKSDFARKIVADAFETTRGRVDTAKVLSLLKYETTERDANFQEALKHLKEAIRRPGSRKYIRFSTKNADGGYEYVELNFSAI